MNSIVLDKPEVKVGLMQTDIYGWLVYQESGDSLRLLSEPLTRSEAESYLERLTRGLVDEPLPAEVMEAKPGWVQCWKCGMEYNTQVHGVTCPGCGASKAGGWAELAARQADEREERMDAISRWQWA